MFDNVALEVATCFIEITQAGAINIFPGQYFFLGSGQVLG